MTHPFRIFQNGSIYHIYNRGVEKRTIFENDADFRHFLLTLSFYQQKKPEGQLSKNNYTLADRSSNIMFDVVAYCLMPNHFHLMLKQIIEGGISKGLSNILNSYTRYFNTKYDRVGHLFQGNFKSVTVLTDEQFLQLFRYILLNPYTNGLTKEFDQYRWSSYHDYLNDSPLICSHEEINSRFASKEAFKTFVSDYADYARTLELIKHDVLE